jgi:hypothetical protein
LGSFNAAKKTALSNLERWFRPSRERAGTMDESMVDMINIVPVLIPDTVLPAMSFIGRMERENTPRPLHFRAAAV